MRLRLVVVAAFLALAAAPAYFAYTTGVLPGPAQALATRQRPPGASRTPSGAAWPAEPMGLTATGTTVLWEQRDPSASAAGLWSYDVGTQRTMRYPRTVGDRQVGRIPQRLRRRDRVAAWAGRRGAGQPQIHAYDAASTRRWTVAQAGSDPTVAGESVIWVESGGAVGDDLIRGSNSLTDEEYSVTADGRVRAIAARMGRLDRRPRQVRGRVGGVVHRRRPLQAGRGGHGSGDRP